MKSNVQKPEKHGEIEYPFLAEHTEFIVLFTGYAEGTVVHTNGPHSIGSYREDWDMSDFTPLRKGSIITLIQE